MEEQIPSFKVSYLISSLFSLSHDLFFACSVVVDELARWKGILMQRSDDCDHYIRLLLHERFVLWNSMTITHDILSRLKNAFDPLNTMENATSKVF